MKKRLSIALLVLFLLAPFSFAQIAVYSGKSTAQATISPLGEAAFNIRVTNEGTEDDTFVIEPSDVLWSIRTEFTPDYTTGIDLLPKEAKETKVFIKPGTSIGPGTYFVELRIRSQKTNKYISEVFVIRVDPKYVDYKVTLTTEVLEATSIDPAKTNSVKAVIANPFPVYMENLSVEASSKFLNKKTIVDIPANSEKVIDFSLAIDSSTPKQEDQLTIVVKQGKNEISRVVKTLYIKEYKLPYDVKIVTTPKFLYTVKEITFTNTEGAQKTQDAHYQKPDISGIVITNPDATTESFDGTDYLVWSGIVLNPNDSYKVYVIEDYRQIAAVIVIGLILIISYFVFRSPIIVKKKGYAIHKKDTGNNEIKVVLYLKNRTGVYLESVRVLERLPAIHKVEPDFGPGTPEPKFRRNQGQHSVLLDWEIALAPHEERIFTYKIKSALPIVGEQILHPVVVQYGKKGKRVSSEPYRMFIE